MCQYYNQEELANYLTTYRLHAIEDMDDVH